MTIFIFAFLLAIKERDDETEKAGIKQAALNYIEGWYEGDAVLQRGESL